MRTRQLLFLVLLAGLLLLRESRIEPLGSVERDFAGWLNTNAARKQTAAPLVFVEITDDDLRASPWPWPPLDYSLFVNAVLPFKPAVVAVEPVLAWKSADAQQIALLHNQLLRAPKGLLGAELGFPEDSATAGPLQEAPVLRHVRGGTAALPEFPAIVRQPAEELRLAGALGFENLPSDGDGRAEIKRVPLLFRYCGQVVPSFVLQAAMLWHGVTAEEVLAAPAEGFIQLGKNLRIPVNAQGGMLLGFGAPLTRFSVGDLLLSAEQLGAKQKTAAPVGRLKNAFVLLARNDQASRTLRFAGRSGSRGELFARAVAAVQKQEFAGRIPFAAELLMIPAGMVLAWLCARRGKFATVLIGIATAAAYVLLALAIFSETLIALPLVLPVGLIAFVVFFRQLA